MLWQWVEMVSDLPHFLVTVYQPESKEDAEFQTTLLFSNIRDVLAIVEEKKNKFEILRVDFLCSGYFKGSDGFTLSRLAEVWIDRKTGSQRFVFADGTHVEMLESSDSDTPANYEKVLTVPVDQAKAPSNYRVVGREQSAS
jgi:hypothetical protein